MNESNLINLEGVRRGDARLKRAKELDPSVTRRPVPASGLVAEAEGKSQAKSKGRGGRRINKGGGVSDRLALTVPELARLVDMHPITIRREIADGRLRAAHSGRRGHYRISRADAETWWRSRGGGVLFDERAERSFREGDRESGDLQNATAGHLADFLAQAAALTRRLEENSGEGKSSGKPFVGADGSELVRAGRGERGARLHGGG